MLINIYQVGIEQSILEYRISSIQYLFPQFNL